MRAGRFDQRLTFDAPVVTPDAAGGQVTAWVTQFTVWAWIHPLTGRERVRSDQVIAELDTKIVVRWDSRTAKITAAWRARGIGGQVYSIIRPPVQADMGRREIELLCSVGVNRG